MTKDKDIAGRIWEFITRTQLRKDVVIRNNRLDRDMRVLDEMVRLLKPELEKEKD